MNLDFSSVLPSFPFILKGIGVTLQIAFFAGVFGICIWDYFIVI